MSHGDFISELKSQLQHVQTAWFENRRALQIQLSMGGEEFISKERKQEYYDLLNLCNSYKCVISHNEEKESDNP